MDEGQLLVCPECQNPSFGCTMYQDRIEVQCSKCSRVVLNHSKKAPKPQEAAPDVPTPAELIKQTMEQKHPNITIEEIKEDIRVKIVGKVKIVVCTVCKGVHAWSEVKKQGKCGMIQMGGDHCLNTEFLEAE